MHGKRILCACFSLATALASCQTTPVEDPAVKEAKVLESEKAIIRNSLDSGKPEAALASLRQLLRERPNDPSLQSLMGLTQLALKNGGRAIKHFQAAYKLDKQVGTGLNLSSAYIEAGDHDRAVRLLTALLKQAARDNYPFKERVYHNLGYSYLRQNRMAKAEEWFLQALEENPTFFPSHLELAHLYERSKRPALAIKSYRKAIDYCTACLEPVTSLADLYVRVGKPVDASRILVQFTKNEGAAPEDRARAGRQLTQITTAGLKLPTKGGQAQGARL